MLTNQDIDKLTSLLATKQDIRDLDARTSRLEDLVQGLVLSQDSLAKEVHEMRLEYVGLTHQINRHDR
jgi:hypothetical protein